MRYLSFFFALLSACLSSCENSTSNLGGHGTNPPPSDYRTEDLAGEWVGTFESSHPNREPIPFYFRCMSDGFPESGADALYRDWSLADSVTYSWVRPMGAMNLTVIRSEEMMFLNGNFEPSKMAIQGDFVMLSAGIEVDNGTFDVAIGPGPGGFSSEDQLSGFWSGEWKVDGSDPEPVSIEMDQEGVLTSGTLGGDSLDLSGPWWDHQLTFSEDSVGRIAPIQLFSISGAQLSLDYLIVTEDGSHLSGPGLTLKKQ